VATQKVGQLRGVWGAGPGPPGKVLRHLGSNPRSRDRGSVVRVPRVEKMEPPGWARDHLGHSQNTFAHQNQGHTMVIRPVLGGDPPGGPGRPWGPGQPCGSLISLCTRVKKPCVWVRTRGVRDRTQGRALFSAKKIEPGRSTDRVREWVGGMFLRVLLHPRAQSDRTSNFSLFSPPDPFRPPGHP
jgi:hypothetical protein